MTASLFNIRKRKKGEIKMGKVYFDDVFVDEFGAYVQACEKCSANIKKVRNEVRIESGLALGVCGGYQCTNKAKYHVDLK